MKRGIIWLWRGQCNGSGKLLALAKEVRGIFRQGQL
jgi:hypothetical protein